MLNQPDLEGRWHDGGTPRPHDHPDHHLPDRAARYPGAASGDDPSDRSTKLELVVNSKTAKALGLTIPPPMLARATEIIQ